MKDPRQAVTEAFLGGWGEYVPVCLRVGKHRDIDDHSPMCRGHSLIRDGDGDQLFISYRPSEVWLSGSPIPEPGVITILLSGALAAGLARLRRRRSRKTSAGRSA